MVEPIRDDESIRQEVLASLERKSTLTASGIGVTVKGGKVTLTGYVSGYWKNDIAGKTALCVYGVKEVANEINVKAPNMRSDREILKDAVHELDTRFFIPGHRVKAAVKNGWVTLEGRVRWRFQKRLTESVVRKLKGTMGVTNNIEIER